MVTLEVTEEANYDMIQNRQEYLSMNKNPIKPYMTSVLLMTY